VIPDFKNPARLVGLEVELIGKKGARRRDLARRLAAHFNGRVQSGFRYLDAGVVADGRRACEVVPCYRVYDDQGRLQVWVTDDLSIKYDIDESEASRVGMFRLVLDDVRLASFVERTARSFHGLDEALQAFMDVMALEAGAPGEEVESADQRLLFDPLGFKVAVIGPYAPDRERVAEVVTRPLGVNEREAFLHDVLGLCRDEGYAPCVDGSTHAHFDNGPWRDKRRLAALIAGWGEEREAILAEVRPDDASAEEKPEFRGQFKPSVLNCVATMPPDVDFRALADTLLAIGLDKRHDWNLAGVCETRPRLPTLECRVLPASVDAAEIMRHLDRIESFLDEVARRAAG